MIYDESQGPDFESNKNIASTFLYLDRFDFPQNFFDERNEQLKKVDLASMQAAVKKLLHSDEMVTVRIGRVDKEEKQSK